MQPTQHIGIDLPKDIVASLNEAVQSGTYHNAGEVVQALVTMWQAQQHSPFANIEELRALCDEGEASGDAEPFTLEELLAKVHKATR